MKDHNKRPGEDARDEQIKTKARSYALEWVTAVAQILTDHHLHRKGKSRVEGNLVDFVFWDVVGNNLGNGNWSITGKKIERMVAMTSLVSDDSLKRFLIKMRNMGIDEDLVVDVSNCMYKHSNLFLTYKSLFTKTL